MTGYFVRMSSTDTDTITGSTRVQLLTNFRPQNRIIRNADITDLTGHLPLTTKRKVETFSPYTRDFRHCNEVTNSIFTLILPPFLESFKKEFEKNNFRKYFIYRVLLGRSH